MVPERGKPTQMGVLLRMQQQRGLAKHANVYRRRHALATRMR
jgi:hypothetical protein